MQSISRITKLLVLSVAGILVAASVQADPILIGTVVESSTESITKMNALIADYNSDFGTSFGTVNAFVDKLEDNSAGTADFSGTLGKSDFEFYVIKDGGATELNVFNALVKFEGNLFEGTEGFDSVDKNVMAFEQKSGASFDYYVSKDGNLGWSLWLAMSGLNPVYTDAGVGSGSISGSGFTRGAISDSSLAYDPIKNGISHISFYSANAAAVPEPSTFFLLGIGGACLIGYGLRRQRREC